MMVPRLVAPHPNAGDSDGLTPEQGLALLVQVRIRDYQRFAAAHTKVPSLDLAARSRNWRWRLVGAFGKWLLEEDSGDLVDLIDSAPDPAARSAATVASACALLEQGQINAAITAIKKALVAAGNRSVDEAWLRIQHARCCADLGRLAEARDAALAVQSIRPDAARDATAAALLGAAATLIFNTSGWGAKNLDEVITAGDTAAVWWRSQVTRWGLDALVERDFKDWSRDTSVTVGAVDKVAKEFESGALLASHSADQGGWRWSSPASGDTSGLAFLLFLFLFYLLIERDHLELSGREITERGVPPLAVVESLDVVEDGALQLTARRPGAAADELLLQGGEERLGDGVVKAITPRAHRDRHAAVAGSLAEGKRYVLGPLV